MPTELKFAFVVHIDESTQESGGEDATSGISSGYVSLCHITIVKFVQIMYPEFWEEFGFSIKTIEFKQKFSLLTTQQ